MSDPEGYNTMQATLSMLTDRVDNLYSLAETKGKQLQVSHHYLYIADNIQIITSNCNHGGNNSRSVTIIYLSNTKDN
jgi:hypothetical protein